MKVVQPRDVYHVLANGVRIRMLNIPAGYINSSARARLDLHQDPISLVILTGTWRSKSHQIHP